MESEPEQPAPWTRDDNTSLLAPTPAPALAVVSPSPAGSGSVPTTSATSSPFTFLSIAGTAFTPFSLDSTGSDDDGFLHFSSRKCSADDEPDKHDNSGNAKNVTLGGEGPPLQSKMGATVGVDENGHAMAPGSTATSIPIPECQCTTRATDAAAPERGTQNHRQHKRQPSSQAFLSPTSPEAGSDASLIDNYSANNSPFSSSPPSSTTSPANFSIVNANHASKQPLLVRTRNNKSPAFIGSSVTTRTPAYEPISKRSTDSDPLDLLSDARRHLNQLQQQDACTRGEISETPPVVTATIDGTAIIRPQFAPKASLAQTRIPEEQDGQEAENRPRASTTTTTTTTRTLPSTTASPAPLRPTVVRTASSHKNKLSLQHPVPDLNVRSGAYVGNIAQLEATAERFSMTSSIEDAIREAHQELKRSDSRRSSILAASVRHSSNASEHGGPATAPPSVLSRQSSIVGINTTARLGGYSPGGYVMSPTHSITGLRLRSGSRTSATGSASGGSCSS